MVDPCGTTQVDGEIIVARLAKYLGVSAQELKEALEKLAKQK